MVTGIIEWELSDARLFVPAFAPFVGGDARLQKKKTEEVSSCHSNQTLPRDIRMNMKFLEIYQEQSRTRLETYRFMPRGTCAHRTITQKR